VKERPILFSAPMVRAILDGRKTQTRRIVKSQLVPHIEFVGGSNDKCTEFEFVGLRHGKWTDDNGKEHDAEWLLYCTEYPEEGVIPIGQLHGAPGDRLWVRETHAVLVKPEDATDGKGRAWYSATTEDPGMVKWKPSIHMPRWASRILLEITNVRVERLQDISGNDAAAEGVQFPCDEHGRPLLRLTGHIAPSKFNPKKSPSWGPDDYLRFEYAELWESINGPGSWAENPWVWVIEFKVSKP
jgi:hypothetical protein